MLQNHFKIALRNLLRHKSYALINVLGLSLGMTCGLLIFLLVKFHLSFDTFHAKADRTYRIVTELHFDQVSYTPGVPNPMANALRNDFPQLEEVAMVKGLHNVLISVPNAHGAGMARKFQEDQSVTFAEARFFRIVDFAWVKGDPKTSLNEPNTAVLTRKYAAKYFGTDNPLGKILRLDNKVDFKITGILENVPGNTDLGKELYLSYPTLKAYVPNGPELEDWGGINSDTRCLVVLPANFTPRQLQLLLPAFSKKYGGAQANSYRYQVQPLRDVHYNGNYTGYASKSLIGSLALVGLFLIVTACINFVNLATAQALRRSKEVGVRKVMGSTRLQLFGLFMTETSLITLLAMGLALLLTNLSLPSLNQLIESQLELHALHDRQLMVFLPLLTLMVILLSGSYPALVLSGFKPVMALKGKISTQQIGGISLRRGLVVLQFTIAQILIIGLIVVTAQTEYAKKAELGFNKDGLVMLPIPLSDQSKMQTMRSRMLQIAGVEKISLNYAAPASGSNNTSNFRFDTRTKDEIFYINTKPADDNYLEAFGLKLVAGRNLIKSDTIREYLVNETFIKKLNLRSPQEAIGKNLRVWGITAPIVGVLKDFHLNSLHNEIPVSCVMSYTAAYATCAVKINLSDVQHTIRSLEKIWNDTYPDNVFEYQFLDDRIAEFYELESIMLKLIRTFSFIAIFISCLGLYGLVSFMAVQKTKEIGIRKVLGATVGNIIALFTKEFTRLIVTAFVVAAPVAWWAMNAWLQDFVYRIPLGASVFALAIALTLTIAALTVGYQSIKAALANPVKALRTE